MSYWNSTPWAGGDVRFFTDVTDGLVVWYNNASDWRGVAP
jgi:hypothetical protein